MRLLGGVVVALNRIWDAMSQGLRKNNSNSANRGRIRDGSVGFVADSSHGKRSVGPGEVLYAQLASTRLRVLVPAAEIARQREVFLVPLVTMVRDGFDVGRVAALVLAKLPTFRVANFDAAALNRLKAWLIDTKRKTRLFADLSDDYESYTKTFRAPVLSQYQQLLVKHCALVVPTKAFADRLAARGARRVKVIEDPYEARSSRPPRAFSKGVLRLCWFGNLGPQNEDFLKSQFSALASRLESHTVALEMVTDVIAAQTVREIGQRAAAQSRTFSVTFVQWSLESACAALERADLVLLPHDPEAPWNHVKSHNRLVTAIRAGRFAIAAPIPSYRELASYAWLGDSLPDGIQWALAHPSEVNERIVAGQAYIESRFSPATIGQKWLHALTAD